jgi:hypothetical protein
MLRGDLPKRCSRIGRNDGSVRGLASTCRGLAAGSGNITAEDRKIAAALFILLQDLPICDDLSQSCFVMSINCCFFFLFCCQISSFCCGSALITAMLPEDAVIRGYTAVKDEGGNELSRHFIRAAQVPLCSVWSALGNLQ